MRLKATNQHIRMPAWPSSKDGAVLHFIVYVDWFMLQISS